MKYWNELDGSTFFSLVFSGGIAIDEIRLFSLRVDNNQSTVALSFDIKELPDKPPKKWQMIQYNACRIGISGSEIENLMVKNLPGNNPMKLTIEKNSHRYIVSASSENSVIEFTASFLTLGAPSVYLTQAPF